MQQVLLERAHYLRRALGRRRDAFAHDEYLARHRFACRRSHPHAIDTIDAEPQRVVFRRVLAHQIAHHVADRRQYLAMTRDEPRIGRTRQQHRALADLARAFDLHARIG